MFSLLENKTQNFQCPNKRVIILYDDKNVEIKSHNNDEKMLSLKDVSDYKVEYLVK